MKKLVLIFFAVLLLSLLGCSKDDTGNLQLENKSNNSIHEVILNGTNYGLLAPGQTETYELVSGTYTVEFRGLNGEGGCSQATVIISAGRTQSLNCRF